MIPAVKKGSALLEDIEATVRSQPAALHIWWLGQSGFLVAAGGRKILFDPYLSDSLTLKYADSEKPHQRMSELVVTPESLTGIDFITSTHNHTDHLDAATLRPLLAGNPRAKLVFPEANRKVVLERSGLSEADRERLVGMDAGTTEFVDDCQIIGTPAAHNELERDPDGRSCFMGFIVEAGGWRIYHSGDTRPIQGLADRLRAHRLDVALLPINGWLEERRVAGNLWGQEAAALADNAGIRWVIPCHFNMFAFNSVTPLAFQEACEARGQSYQILGGGERFTLEPAS